MGWQGYDFELQGDTQVYVTQLAAALAESSKAQTMVSYAQVHDLSAYSSRIEGIGIEKPDYSPYIAKKKDDEGWFPENVVPIISYTPHGETGPIAVPVTEDALARSGSRETRGAGLNDRGALATQTDATACADDITSTFSAVLEQLKERRFDLAAERKELERKSLILRANIQAVEYEEERRERTQSQRAVFREILRPDCILLPHQREGVAWLAFYRSKAEHQVRARSLLTTWASASFQLLTFMARLLEEEPTIDRCWLLHRSLCSKTGRPISSNQDIRIPDCVRRFIISTASAQGRH